MYIISIIDHDGDSYKAECFDLNECMEVIRCMNYCNIKTIHIEYRGE